MAGRIEDEIPEAQDLGVAVSVAPSGGPCVHSSFRATRRVRLTCVTGASKGSRSPLR
jgi:hypothetical protein